MKITKITLIDGPGTDTLTLQTNLPCGTWPYEGFQTAKIDVAKGVGLKYCEEHFSGIEVNVIKIEGLSYAK
jgi:hypothetical protein